jgi:hypothetical protein
MDTKTNTASAAPKRAENIVQAWLAFAAAPERKETRNTLADFVEEDVRRRLPDGDGRHGNAADIRQQACLRLLGHHLTGNAGLLQATKTGNENEIDKQLRISIASAVRFERMEATRKAGREATRRRELTEENGGTCRHPAGRSFWELPYELQRQLVLAALRTAVAQGLVTRPNASVVTRMIEENLTEAEVSRALGVSRQAINQQVLKVRKHLPKLLASQEFPL